MQSRPRAPRGRSRERKASRAGCRSPAPSVTKLVATSATTNTAGKAAAISSVSRTGQDRADDGQTGRWTRHQPDRKAPAIGNSGDENGDRRPQRKTADNASRKRRVAATITLMPGTIRL